MNECPRCGRLPGNGHTEICALQGEIERLRHDIERHIRVASELATENAELRKPDCRACAFYYACVIGQHEICIAGAGFDYARDPVRLYEKEGKV